ncbi:unnamed protein product [Schistosoma rodhaini]|nr:hypothetical protein Smp_036780 [Schistosoma mansoni]CAH8624314.1 unnamed protein product [Schistosoma haematobium]CAH8626568.1 unnamed protein product [Schistosoma rodhaini]CAH8631617.1 unnamed protein product [Schistosoma haematobium]|eukprot:XP_018653150.1 hypothetical protein Smp_036780 [Schistosoma mansoni]
MAQGKLKVKTKLPKGVKSGKSERSLQKQSTKPMRKGTRVIKPKKERLKEAHEMKKHMEKLLKKSVEKQAIEKVSSCEPRSLKIVKE